MAGSRCYTWMPEMWETIGAVCRVSWYEGEAYACFVGMRLPTEAEWEKAVSWNSAE